MKVKMKYFGIIAEITAKEEELFTLESGNLSLLREQVERQYPGIRDITYSVAINRELVTGLSEATENSEVALLPPYAGG